MSSHRFTLAVALALLVGGVGVALAQRGTGEERGMAQRAEQPPLQTLEGTLKKIEIGPCEHTTGRALVGAHLMVETAGGETVNAHLGPAAQVRFVTDQLQPGDALRLRAFTTDRLKAGHYIVQELRIEPTGRTLTLREEDLQPVWARGAGRGAAAGRGWGPRAAADRPAPRDGRDRGPDAAPDARPRPDLERMIADIEASDLPEPTRRYLLARLERQARMRGMMQGRGMQDDRGRGMGRGMGMRDGMGPRDRAPAERGRPDRDRRREQDRDPAAHREAPEADRIDRLEAQIRQLRRELEQMRDRPSSNEKGRGGSEGAD
jgi:hypothetical protein